VSAETAKEVYELLVSLTEADIDELDHVNNTVYLRWVQEAAVAHWRHAATERQQAEIVWVVLRHEIDYKRPAIFGDVVKARTWVGTASTHAFDRHTEIVRDADGTLLARARTVWCPIDLETGRPMKVGDDVRQRFSVPEAPGTSLRQGRIDVEPSI